MLKKLVSCSQSTLHIHCIYLWYTHSRSLDCHGKARSQSGLLKSFKGTPKKHKTSDFKNYDCVPSFSGLLVDAPKEAAGSVVQGPVDQSSSQSADAARAARMSRVGTKVGRELCGNSVG